MEIIHRFWDYNGDRKIDISRDADSILININEETTYITFDEALHMAHHLKKLSFEIEEYLSNQK